MKKIFSSKKGYTIFLGLISVGLYFVLFTYADTLINFAVLTPEGHPLYALIPIIIAFIISLAHGAFTGEFWETVGLKANYKEKK